MAASTHFPILQTGVIGTSEAGSPAGAVRPPSVHSMSQATALPRLPAEARAEGQLLPLELDDVYREHFSFVWRSAKRLGVREASLDDVVQEIFVIVHRRLGDFEGRSSIRTWLFGITIRVVRDHRRACARRDARDDGAIDPDTLQATAPGPADAMARAEAVRVLYQILDEMDDDRRDIFVMAELEQLPMPDIAAMLGMNVNTAYARLRAARQTFEEAAERHRARDEWRFR